MATLERRSWPFAAFLPAVVTGQQSRRQLKGVILLLLLCGQEAHAGGPSFRPPQASNSTEAESDAVESWDYEGPQFPAVESVLDVRQRPHLGSATNDSSNGSKYASMIDEKGPAPLSVNAGFVTWETPRRLTAVNTQFSVEVMITPPSNLQSVGPSPTQVVVHAGVRYRQFVILADSGLGVDPKKILVKLVPYDLRATLQTCAEVTPFMGSPFDGTPDQAGLDAEDVRNTFTNSDNGFSFPEAGKWRLCYAYNGVNWEELTPAIVVIGSEQRTAKFWCALSLLEREVCQNDPTANPGCECKGKVEGYKINNKTGATTPLGLPNPAWPIWKTMLTFMDKDCGVKNTQPFFEKTSVVKNHAGYEIHNYGQKQAGTTYGVWKVCYCVAFDKDNGADAKHNGVVTPCYADAPADFPQEIGTVITVDIQTRQGTKDITVYPTLRFDIVLECGTRGNTIGSPGGCTDTNVVRYKIVEQKAENNLLYFDSGAGCRFLPQVATLITGAKTLGGHIGPKNCIDAVDCKDEPEILGPKLPTWSDIQMDASYENGVMIEKSYDVCYCDSNCLNSAYWFKAGSIKVKPVTVFFSDDGNRVVQPDVNTMYYLIVQGAFGESSWSKSGSRSREMKILRDDDAIVDKISCLSTPQPDMVSGHRLVSGNTDYTDPSETLLTNNWPSGQRYGDVYITVGDPTSKAPNIKILEPGWYAVCYCDSNCNEMLNWSVFGRQLVAGPTPGQKWTRYVGVAFDLQIKGWHFKPSNRLRILSTSNELGDCGTMGQSDRVAGPANKAELKEYNKPDCLIKGVKYDPRGTELEFDRIHDLKDGDRIKLESVNANDAEADKMFNTVHEIFVTCDHKSTPTKPSCHKILIPIRFPAASFPNIQNPGSIKWTRTSVEDFRKIKISVASPEGRGYIVCWSPEKTANVDFRGQAGTITVKDSIEMPEAAVGLTTIMPDIPAGGAPIVIAFKTGDIAKYSQANGPMSIKIVFMSGKLPGDPNGPFVDVLEAATWDLKKLKTNVDYDTMDEATQAVCGKIFSEMWSENENGFPMPQGCFVDRDDVNDKQRLLQLHIVFSPRNHLQKNTKYMVVMNAQVKEHLKKDFPDEGAVYIWSMDDANLNPYGVVELGRAYPRPENRVPPRGLTGELELNKDPDGMFDPQKGFKIEGMNHPKFKDNVVEMYSYCRAHDTRYPDQTPIKENECKVCKTEYDCGNGNEATGQPPDSALEWCVSPIDILCPAAGGTLTKVPSFKFALMAKYGRPILRGSIMRIFLSPFTQWNIKPPTCRVAMVECSPPGGVGDCSAPICEAQSVVGGVVVGIANYPVNILRITLPNIMTKITSKVKHTIAVGSLPLPPGGFLPQSITAEMMKEGEKSPDFWPSNTVAGARIYYQPKITSSSIVTSLGDGNEKPFRGDKDNLLYLRVVVGTTLWAKIGDGIKFQFRLPLGYKCDTPPQGLAVPRLGVVGNAVPSYQGKLGGNQARETHWSNEVTPIVACTLNFREHMIYYAGAAVFVGVRVDNPKTALKQSDKENTWTLVLKEEHYQIRAEYFKLAAPEGKTGYSGQVPTLGKLENIIIMPSNFGLGQRNSMNIFFRTEQDVGTVLDTQTEVWVDAPSGYDFGRYCGAYTLGDEYYIPEPVEKTFRLPVGQLVECRGAVTDSTQLTYNRARIATTGRLLKKTTYGFRLVVNNVKEYIRSQLNGWLLWTYLRSSGAGVDGAYETARFNERIPPGPGESFGCYQKGMKPGNLAVTIMDLRPTMGNVAPTEITFLPIIVQLPMQRAVRILAPSGYIWDFLQTEFRYKAPNRGIPANQVVPGAEQDLPISGVPAKPISEPRNKLAIDYMQAEWIPGVKYGFIAKIRVPPLPPTTSSNVFSIEFGYDGLIQKDRLEAGVVGAPLVRRIINGMMGFTTSIMGRRAEISFSMRLITKIPRAGGLVITGPPNFVFDAHCQPKPLSGFPELPYDSTCLFQQIAATGAPEISIVAGPKGIPPFFYKFSLMAKNPPQARPLDQAGNWTFHSYGVVSEQTVLDYQTTVNGYAVSSPMYSAAVIAPPKVPDCYFLSLKEQEDFPGRPITNCAYEDWQFYRDAGGFRDDRPNKQSALIFRLQLQTDSYTGKDIVVRAPEGYQFNAECKVVVESAAVFNDTNIGGNLPKGFIQKYAVWPQNTKATNCFGQENLAYIRIECGADICLTAPNKYIFRLHILRNPPQTPSPNKFILEYNGEASEPFEGVEIWAFTNTSILPTTTAASLRHRPTVNNVTVYLRPTNDLPTGGHLRIEAPAGFIIQTNCKAQVMVHKDEKPNITAIPAGSQRQAVIAYSEFLPGDYTCAGDVTMSSRSRLHILKNDKYLKKGVLYEFLFEVTNPQTTTAYQDPWIFTSFRDNSPNDIIDTATVPGFPINDAVPSFAWMTPNSLNALASQLLEFNMSFPMNVIIGDIIEIVAPVTFYFSEPGDGRCPGYQFLDGSMRKTIPVCGANTILWNLQEEMVPAGTGIRFLVRVTNPPRTPIINLFQVRQVSPTGKRKSSRIIPGYHIIPELESVVVLAIPPTPPSGYCRPLINVITGHNCSAAGSTGAVKVSFMPMKPAKLVQLKGRIDNEPFDFSKAKLPKVQLSINSRDKSQITANMEVRPGTMAEIVIEGITNPTTPGMSVFTVTTYQGDSPLVENMVDEKLDLPSFEVLQYIHRVSSRVNPIYYGVKDATVSFELEPYMEINMHDVLRITRPPGYTIKPGSFQGFRDLRFSEHGLDRDRAFSATYENPEDYYVVLSQYIRPRTRILFTLSVDLPKVQEAVVNWYFKTYMVLPHRDTDGEILDGAPVPYPWIGRNGKKRGLKITGTNDGAFTGFLLVGQVPFRVTPELKTPGAEIRLSINFALPYTVQAVQEVRMEVTGPAGFVFRDACFSLGSPVFRKCTGYRNTATLVSTVRSILGSNITIHLAVTNPGATPLKNTWNIAIYRDEETQYVNWSPGPGYEILPMTVVYRGNNQLAVSDTGFFDFTPLKRSTSEILHVVIVPPPNQGYRLLCTGIQKLGFQGTPVCISGPVNSQLELRFANGTLSAGVRYTLGVGVLNPGGKPFERENYWGILLQDHTQKTFDGNKRVAGLDLKSIPVRAGQMGWLTSEPKVMNTVSMQMRVLHMIPAGMVTRIVIGAPYGVRFMEDPNAVKVSPLQLPLYEANPSEVANPSDVPNAAGPLLMLNLDLTKDIRDGMYNIRFDCSNPGVVVWDNTWSLIVMKNIEVEYSHYNVGFNAYQISPYKIVSGGRAVANHARRCLSSVFLPVILAGFLIVADVLSTRVASH